MNRLVFLDALMELGVESEHPSDLSEHADTWHGSRQFGDASVKWWSEINVRLFRTGVEIVWNHYVMDGDEYGVQVYMFLFPSEWTYALAHLAHLIELAKHKELTGETLPIIPIDRTRS